MGFWSAFAFGGLALWTAALIGMTWLVKRKRCSAPTFRIEVGSVSLRFGF